MNIVSQNTVPLQLYEQVKNSPQLAQTLTDTTYIPIIIGLSVDTSHAISVPRLSPINSHSSVG